MELGTISLTARAHTVHLPPGGVHHTRGLNNYKSFPFRVTVCALEMILLKRKPDTHLPSSCKHGELQIRVVNRDLQHLWFMKYVKWCKKQIN